MAVTKLKSRWINGNLVFVDVNGNIAFHVDAPGSAGANIEFVKTVTGIVDATATTVLTVTVPNAAHACVISLALLASLGAGGAIGADEATAIANGKIVVTRTPGVAAVATAVALSNAASAGVAGAATIALAYAVTAMVGAVGATQTFTVTATITKGGGASAAHSCLVSVGHLNANALGITVA